MAWPELLADFRSANAVFDAVLATAAAGPEPPASSLPPAAPAAPTARAILVVNPTLPDGGTASDQFPAELDSKAYALVQRLHLLEHRNQVRTLLAALSGGIATA